MEFLINLSEGSQFAIQLAIVLICLFYGAKKGGIALGLLGGIGLIVLVFGFAIEPGKPAIDVMLTILAVVVTSATLQASGGLDVNVANCGKNYYAKTRNMSVFSHRSSLVPSPFFAVPAMWFIPCCRLFMISLLKMTSVRNAQWRPVPSLHKWVSSPPLCPWLW